MSPPIDFDNEEDFGDSLIGLMAGEDCPGSGIRDEVLKQRLKDYLREEAGKDGGHGRLLMKRLTILARESFMDDDRIEQGYSLEDVSSFIKWLDREMGFSI